MNSVALQLAEYVSSVSYESLPPEVLTQAKRVMLDTLIVAWAGSNAPGCAECRETVVAEGGAAESGVWAHGDRLPAPAAAFLNSTFAAALDYNSLHRKALVHADIVNLPAALAVSERQRSSGREFLTALVVGNELICRLGAASGPHQGWFNTSIYGGFSAAAASAKLLGLDAEGICNAFGIALSQLSGTQQPIVEHSVTKRVQSGFATRAGVFSGLLAACGVTAPRETFEGKFGLWRMFQDGDADAVLNGLGSAFELMKIGFKKYPCYGCNNIALEAAIGLVTEHDVQPNEVIDVEIAVSPFMNRFVGGPFEPEHDPQVAAQFNVRYAVATAILRRRFGVAETQDQAIFDPAVRSMVERIRVVVEEQNTAIGPTELAITINTRGKGKLARRTDYLPGTPEHPLTEQEVRAKASECTALGAAPLTSAQILDLFDRVENVERRADMYGFLEGLSATAR